jgi:uncharacterized protein YukE
VPFEGMDIDQVADLAKQLDANARTLTGIAALLGGLAEALGQQWRGPAAAVFARDFEASHRPAIVAAAQQLSDLHARVIANLDQQQTASAVTGFGGGAGAAAGAGAGVGTWPTVDRVWNDAGTVSTIVGLAGIPVSLLADGSRVDEAFEGAGYVGTAMGVVNVGIDVDKASQALDQRHYAAAVNDEADGVTDGLKAYPNPIVWGIGVDATLLHDDVNRDWSDTPSPLSWANLKNDYWPVYKSMYTIPFWEQAGETLWGAMN